MIIKTQSLSFEHSFGSGRKRKDVFLYGPKLSDENTPAKQSPSFANEPSMTEEKVFSESSLTTPGEIYFRQL
jgi:hypothetical protein